MKLYKKHIGDFFLLLGVLLALFGFLSIRNIPECTFKISRIGCEYFSDESKIFILIGTIFIFGVISYRKH